MRLRDLSGFEEGNILGDDGVRNSALTSIMSRGVFLVALKAKKAAVE
jgi:hypothetical protein